MNKQYNVLITDGTGTESVLEGDYSVTAQVTGYENESIEPSSVTITSEDTYLFEIEASGSLTLHVTETGESTGVAIEGAKFIRCDKNGNEYGTEITTNSDGNAVFEHMPYATNSAPDIYYKQTGSDGNHNFDSALKKINLLGQLYTEEIINAPASTKTFTLSDKYYQNLPISSGTITLE